MMQQYVSAKRTKAQLREEVEQFHAALKAERAKLLKQKDQIKKLHAIIAKEQSKRMQAENKPEIAKERDRLTARVEALERDLPGHKQNSATVLQYARENKLLMEQIDAYETKMSRQKFPFTRIPGLTITLEVDGS